MADLTNIFMGYGYPFKHSFLMYDTVNDTWKVLKSCPGFQRYAPFVNNLNNDIVVGNGLKLVPDVTDPDSIDSVITGVVGDNIPNVVPPITNRQITVYDQTFDEFINVSGSSFSANLTLSEYSTIETIPDEGSWQHPTSYLPITFSGDDFTYTSTIKYAGYDLDSLGDQYFELWCDIDVTYEYSSGYPEITPNIPISRAVNGSGELLSPITTWTLKSGSGPGDVLNIQSNTYILLADLSWNIYGTFGTVTISEGHI